MEWIGFDMDYTLAVYHQEEMDRLSINATLEKMVARGYPASLKDAVYRTDFPIRGLLVDRHLGNVLKMDRYKYVKRAYHGLRELSKDERREAYHRRRIEPASDRYHWVDTLYGLSEVSVYAAVVEHLSGESETPDYDQIFADVRDCIDQSHQDGSILDHIEADHPRYVWRDPRIAAALDHLRDSGKRLFVVTNSHAPYTRRMMRYLLGEDWQWRFDLVITASKKPRFFTEERPFHEVRGDDEDVELVLAKSLELGSKKIYAGGNVETLQAALGCDPDRVLYVGDHIFGDVLRAKKKTAWRTMMIIQEMGDELHAHAAVEHSIAQLDMLSIQRRRLENDLRIFQRRLRALEELDEEGAAHEAEIARNKREVGRLTRRVRSLRHEFDELENAIAHRFHPYWGSLFKAAGESSSFGHQVETYADIYTSHVSNLLNYSASHYFESPRDLMPHELG